MAWSEKATTRSRWATVTADGARPRTAAGKLLCARAWLSIPGRFRPRFSLYRVMVQWDTAARSGATVGWARDAASGRNSRPWTYSSWMFTAAFAAAGFGCPLVLLDRFWVHAGSPLLAGTVMRGGFAEPSVYWTLWTLHPVHARLVLQIDRAAAMIAVRFAAGGMTTEQASGWADRLGTDMLIEARPNTSDQKKSCGETIETELLAWVEAFGPDQWAAAVPWFAAGYTPGQAATLLTFPVEHPDRPGPDQLAVMAALREPDGRPGAR